MSLFASMRVSAFLSDVCGVSRWIIMCLVLGEVVVVVLLNGLIVDLFRVCRVSWVVVV